METERRWTVEEESESNDGRGIGLFGLSLAGCQLYQLHPHLRAKVRKRSCTLISSLSCVCFAPPRLRNQIVEFAVMERGGEDKQVLIRSTKVGIKHIKGKGMLSCNLLFVISPENHEIITAYYAKSPLYSRTTSPVTMKI